MSDQDSIVKIKFDGGLATLGRIYLYEYSRSQYALSRFITIVEQYRLTGQVIDRVTESKTIDMIVSAPEKGSFGLEILVPLAPIVGDAAKISFEALFSYVWAKLLPSNPARDDMVVKLAETELLRERERTAQSAIQQQGETERLALLRDILASKDATIGQALSVVDRALEAADPRNAARGYDQEVLITEREMLLADEIRERALLSGEDQLSQLDSKDIDRLVKKVRPMVSEIGLPLRNSAERCMIGDASNDNTYVRLDAERLQQVNTREVDDEEFSLDCVIRSYDKYTGRGKIESDYFEKTMSFMVEFDRKSEFRNQILTAMSRNKVNCTFSAYKDPAGEVTSLILQRINEG